MNDNARQLAVDSLREARALRHDDPERAAEAAAWSRCAFPESIPARKLEIRLLHQLDHLDEADTLVAQSLLLSPNNPGLLRLHAERLVERGDVRSACEIVEHLLRRNFPHCGTLRLAARIAETLGDSDRAMAFLDDCLAEQPGDVNAREMLFTILLETDQPEAARIVLKGFASPPVHLRAALLVHEGRLTDAAAIIEEAIDAGDECPATLCAWLDVLEAIGDTARIIAAIQRLTDLSETATLIRVAEAALAVGDFRTVVKALRPQVDPPTPGLTRSGRRRMLTLLSIAHTMLGRREEAEAIFVAGALGTEGTADMWLRALRGGVLAELSSAESAGADPTASPLGRLLRSAHDVLAEATDAMPDDSTLPDHLALCRGALGLPAGHPACA